MEIDLQKKDSVVANQQPLAVKQPEHQDSMPSSSRQSIPSGKEILEIERDGELSAAEEKRGLQLVHKGQDAAIKSLSLESGMLLAKGAGAKRKNTGPAEAEGKAVKKSKYYDVFF